MQTKRSWVTVFVWAQAKIAIPFAVSVRFADSAMTSHLHSIQCVEWVWYCGIWHCQYRCFHTSFHTRSHRFWHQQTSGKSSTLFQQSSTLSTRAGNKKGAPKCSKTVTNTILMCSGGNETSQSVISSRSRRPCHQQQQLLSSLAYQPRCIRWLAPCRQSKQHFANQSESPWQDQQCQQQACRHTHR